MVWNSRRFYNEGLNFVFFAEMIQNGLDWFYGILVEKADFKPPLWILWRCTINFISFSSDYVWFLTILADLRYFTHVDVASGPFKIALN